MPDVVWWAAVLGAIASIGMILGGIWGMWSPHGKKFIRRTLGIEGLQHEIALNGKKLDVLHAEHKVMQDYQLQSAEDSNKMIEVLASELDIEDEKLPDKTDMSEMYDDLWRGSNEWPRNNL